ncbi:hypothetical protein Pla110_00460 [Polystyrenella longa]|uniref:Magnesium and cobalt efflux protein CorC n=1 Tax=Polystyrenella longa TaxID=2528007 RepID=A0A518CGJ3_9PLAN|nr:CNNM domain-containing protein [Polystyrenella longa]QDU78345.1 hypothetical protein Pla110_00460 [Polystyrenella longa]
MTEFIESADLWLSGLIAMIFLTLASGFFSGSETSFFYLSHDEIRTLRVGKPRERLVAILLSNPDRLLTAILFWNLVINLLYFAVSIVITQRLTSENLNIAAGAFGLLSLFGLILFGEVMPKSIAVFARRKVATTVSWPLAAAVRVLDPIIPSLSWVTRLVRRTFWPTIEREPVLRPEDLERAVDAFQLSEEIIKIEQQVLHNILDLSEIKVEEIMRPRGTYETTTGPLQIERMKEIALAGDFILVQDEDRREDANQVFSLQNFTNLNGKTKDFTLDELVYVPWCADLATALTMLRQSYTMVAAVVNEYGETIGVITQEDLLDTILMPQPSRTKRLLRRDPILEIGPGKYHVEGLTTLRHFSARFEIDFQNNNDGQLTVAGMLSEQLDRLPQLGDHVTWQGFDFKVVNVSKVGQYRLLVSRKPAPAEDTDF